MSDFTKEHLLSLMHSRDNPALTWLPNNYEILKTVEYLIRNGVIVLPCKVGKTIFAKEPFAEVIREYKVDEFVITDGVYIITKEMSLGFRRGFNINEFGKTVFLTRKEAKQA